MIKGRIQASAKSHSVLSWAFMILILVILAHGIFAPRGLYLDFANFFDAGQKVAAGELVNLYDEFAQIGGNAPYGNMRFFGTPISAYAYAPLAAFPPNLAAIIFKVFSTICILSGLFIFYRRLTVNVTEEERSSFFWLFCAAAFLFHPFWTVMQVGGQSSAAAFLGLVVGLHAYEKGNDWTAALALSIVIGLKPLFVAVAILLFLLSTGRFRIAIVVCGIIGLVLSLAAMGWPLHEQFLHTALSEGGQAPERTNSHILAWLGPLLYSDENANTFSTVRMAASAALVFLLMAITIVARNMRQNDAAARYFTFLMCTLAALAISPTVWGHYLMFLFVPIALVISAWARLPKGVVLLVALAILVAPFQNLLVFNQFWKLPIASEGWFALSMAAIRSLPMLFTTLAILIYARSILTILDTSQKSPSKVAA